jgi:hypothetical protein
MAFLDEYMAGEPTVPLPRVLQHLKILIVSLLVRDATLLALAIKAGWGLTWFVLLWPAWALPVTAYLLLQPDKRPRWFPPVRARRVYDALLPAFLVREPLAFFIGCHAGSAWWILLAALAVMGVASDVWRLFFAARKHFDGAEAREVDKPAEP